LYIQPLYIYRFLVIVDFGKEIFRHHTKLILILAVKTVYHFSPILYVGERNVVN